MNKQLLLVTFFFTTPITAAFVTADPDARKLFEGAVDGIEMCIRAGQYESANGLWEKLNNILLDNQNYANQAERDPAKVVSPELLDLQRQRLDQLHQRINTELNKIKRAERIEHAKVIFWWTVGIAAGAGCIYWVAKKCGWFEEIPEHDAVKAEETQAQSKN